MIIYFRHGYLLIHIVNIWLNRGIFIYYLSNKKHFWYQLLVKNYTVNYYLYMLITMDMLFYIDKILKPYNSYVPYLAESLNNN